MTQVEKFKKRVGENWEWIGAYLIAEDERETMTLKDYAHTILEGRKPFDEEELEDFLEMADEDWLKERLDQLAPIDKVQQGG